MFKKYFPYIVFIAAAALLFWVKKNQKGADTINRTEISAGKSVSEPFNRSESRLIFTKHARCRMGCRQIDESEVREVLKEGVINYDKIEEGKKGKTYPLEGTTHDGQHVRIVIAPHENELVLVTVIDLEKEWACDCY